jgi:hypothetical protein
VLLPSHILTSLCAIYVLCVWRSLYPSHRYMYGTTVQLRLFEHDRCRLIRVALTQAQVISFLVHSCDMTESDLRWWLAPTPERQVMHTVSNVL